ncbi:hypothetical protein HJ588_01225 [Flexivirga sp. ID2601S]|uniref:Uncharacterized protein n=1 Tax=Flexivirga aerilata TaxID=1656889 RepID=A0A849ADB6_9MICO|nr:hypothetical protein [Flexivirga aerilata]NNG37897.1 hypothetical protein [Flexivirga aerilata]
MQLPKRRGVALTVIGAVLIVILAPAALAIGIWRGVAGGVDELNNQDDLPPGSTYRVDDSAERTILVAGSYDEAAPTPLPTCRVTAPDGSQVPVAEPTGKLSVEWGDASYHKAAVFTPRGEGDYRIDCGESAKVVRTTLANDISRKVLVPLGIGIGAAALSFIAGVIMLVVGIVKLSNSGKERRLAQQAAGGYYPGGYYPPQGYPEQHGQQPPQKPGNPGNPDDPYAR